MAGTRKSRRNRAPGTLQPQQLRALFENAQQLQRAGRLSDAEKRYQQILKHIPEHPETLHYLGLVHLQRGNFDAADKFMRKSLAQRRTPVFCSNYGLLLEQRGRHAEAAEYFSMAVGLAPDYAEGWFNLAVARENEGDLRRAVEAYGKALEVRPGYIKALSNLATVQDALGDHDGAAATSGILTGLNPEDGETCATLAMALQRLGGDDNLERARTCLESAIRQQPDNPELRRTLALMLDGAGQFEAALAVFAELVRSTPDSAALRVDHARCLVKAGQLPLAAERLQQVLAPEPGNRSALTVLGDVHRFAGRFDEARSCYRDVLDLDPMDVAALHGLSQCGPVTQADVVLLEGLQRAASGKPSALAQFALGKALDDLGRYEEAMASYRRGNAMRRRRLHYSAQAHTRQVDGIIRFFGPDFFADHAGAGTDSDAPVFVLGAPRSGTTLVERILCAHPQVASAGEMPWLAQLSRRGTAMSGTFAFPDRLTDSGAGSLLAEGLAYMAELQRRAGKESHPRMIDKTPENFLYIGYIHAILPQAHIVHCRRHPFDTCLSIYFQSFDSGHPYAFELREIAAWYRDYLRLMRHWDALFPGMIIHVDYEELVRNTERSARRLVREIGLEWNPACLEYHRDAGTVLTASNWQARQPVYGSSLDRWRNYADHAPELLEYLRELP